MNRLAARRRTRSASARPPEPSRDPASASPRPRASTARPRPAPSTRHAAPDRRAVAARVQAEAARLGYRRDARRRRCAPAARAWSACSCPTSPTRSSRRSWRARNPCWRARGYSAAGRGPGRRPGARSGAGRRDGLPARRRADAGHGRRARRPGGTRCLARGTPVVLINRAEAEPRAPSVVTDDREGMRLAVAHLAELGHRRIGHLAGPPSLSTGDLRRRGFEAAMAERGLDAAAVEPATAYTREAGAEAARRLLDAPPGPHRDRLRQRPAGARRLRGAGGQRACACRETSRSPGHNDMPLVDMVAPPLTTVRIAHSEMGREAAHLLLRAIEDRAAPPARGTAVLLRPELVVRASPPRRDRADGQRARARPSAPCSTVRHRPVPDRIRPRGPARSPAHVRHGSGAVSCFRRCCRARSLTHAFRPKRRAGGGVGRIAPRETRRLATTGVPLPAFALTMIAAVPPAGLRARTSKSAAKTMIPGGWGVRIQFK